MSNKNKVIDIDETIKKATKEAIKEYNKELKQEKKKKVFHNTKLLLSHYNDLKTHTNKAIHEINQIGSSLGTEVEELDRDELYILSIRRSKSKTLIMIAHIEMAMEQLKFKQRTLCSIEKYQALDKYYIQGLTYEKIAEDLNCGVITVRRWVNEMINELGILLFGIDGLRFDVI